MAEEKLEVTKLRERIGYGIEIVEAAAKAKGLAFDKEMFLEGSKLGDALGKKRDYICFKKQELSDKLKYIIILLLLDGRLDKL